MKTQIKKASSALTPKASHLKLVSIEDTNMNNSNAVNINNQVNVELAIVCEAKKVAKIVNQSAYALRSIAQVIDIDTANKDIEEDGLSSYILGGLSQAIQIITERLEDVSNDLGGTLIKGGFAHE